MTHVWWWRSRLSERKGEPCEVLARGGMNSIKIRFADGLVVITSRYAVRKAPRMKAQISKFDHACLHFNGTSAGVCLAGVQYADVRSPTGPIGTRFPCLPGGAENTSCVKRQYPTEEQAQARADETQRVLEEHLDRQARGICRCGTEAAGAVQNGRCIHLEPCGHRLGQGNARVYWKDVLAARAAAK